MTNTVTNLRIESDSLGNVEVPADKLWGAQTQRSLEHFSIGHDLIPREMITAYATLKRRRRSRTTPASGSNPVPMISSCAPVTRFSRASTTTCFRCTSG